jgi:acyl-ACP thioesterase
MNYAPRKIKLLDELTEIDRRRVMVYQMDSNHHMNNEAYIDLALEYITNVEDIKEIRAEYKKQFVKDELIVIKTGEKDGIKQFTFWDVQGTLRCIVNFS